MTLTDMFRRAAVSVLGVLLVASPVVSAQIGSAAAAAARAAASPTGPMSAVTKAAAAIRASRAAAATTRGAAAGATAGSRATAVTGYLWTAQNSPLSNATVQLRNTVNGQVEMYTKTNAVGEFLFTDMKGGSYVIEYVGGAAENVAAGGAAGAASNAGGVMAVGSPFSIAPGETVATFVRTLNNVTLIVPDLASNVAASAVQTAASAGVTAVVTPLAPEAPEPASNVKPAVK